MLRDVENGVVASICAKQVSDPSLRSFGYRAAFDAVVDRLRVVERRCFEPEFSVDAEGHVACRFVDNVPLWEDPSCECSAAGRKRPSPELRAAAERFFEQDGLCGAQSSSATPCANLCLCEIEQLSGTQLEACHAEPQPGPGVDGWCYVDADQGLGVPTFQDCPRELRFVGYNLTRRFSGVLVCNYERATPDVSAREAKGFGASCTPRIENDVSFGSFSQGDVSVDVGTPECRTSLCLVNHFEGRVSCPYGQSTIDLTRSADAPERCRTPRGDPVETRVSPQLVDRRSRDAVYCSCRCAGPAGSGPFCACPEGFSCRPLIPAAGIEPGVEGSYCVRIGREFDPRSITNGWCDIDANECGDGGNP